jgi:hypothetical protein
LPIEGMSTADELELRRFYLFRPCETREELKQWLLAYLGLDLPDCIVDEDSNSTPLDMVWETYSKMRANDDPEFNRVLYFACRDGFKTLGAAAIEVLAITHLGRSVAHMAAIKEQALKAQQYVKGFFRRPHLRDFVISDNETKTEIRRFYNPVTKHNLTAAEFEALSADQQALHEEIRQALTMYREREDYIKVIICTMQGANSEHVPLMIIDEVDVVSNPAAYAEAQNIPSERGGKMDLTILTSTRKFSFGLVQDEINRAVESGLHIRHWNIIDITERCPPERHHPELPRITIYRSADTLKSITPAAWETLTQKEQESFVKSEGFDGCLNNCKLFAMCKTRLATHQKSNSTFLNKISTVTNKFRRQRTIEMAKAQLLCWKPASTGLIYGRFDRTRHVLSPAQAYFKVFGEHPTAGNRLTKAEFLTAIADRDVQWYGGMDFGMGHNFVYVNSFKDGQRLFVSHCFSSPGLETPQAIEQLEPWREQFDPVVYPDMADTQAIRAFKRAGWKMRTWKKGAGSIAAGITAVQGKMNPVMADEPELYFIHDVDEDPGMALLIQRIQEYHWKLDAAGKPTGVPQDDDDDEADALRYDVMNVFPMKGGLVAGHNDVTTAGENDAGATGLTAANQSSGPQNWVQQMIAEATGASAPSQHPPRQVAPGAKPRLFPDRPRMKVQNPDGTPASYYGEEDAGKPKKRRGSNKDAEPDENASRGRSGRLIWNIE